VNLVHNAVADSGQCLVGEARPVGGHRIFRGDGPHRANATVRSEVAHDADRANWQEYREVLPNLRAATQTVDLLADDGIRVSQQRKILFRDFADDAYGKSRAREWLAVNDFRRESQGAPDLANFVLEQIA
jgi:hypothetical protein